MLYADTSEYNNVLRIVKTVRPTHLIHLGALVAAAART
jgi:hypothetical protein